MTQVAAKQPNPASWLDGQTTFNGKSIAQESMTSSNVSATSAAFNDVTRTTTTTFSDLTQSATTFSDVTRSSATSHVVTRSAASSRDSSTSPSQDGRKPSWEQTILSLSHDLSVICGRPASPDQIAPPRRPSGDRPGGTSPFPLSSSLIGRALGPPLRGNVSANDARAGRRLDSTRRPVSDGFRELAPRQRRAGALCLPAFSEDFERDVTGSDVIGCDVTGGIPSKVAGPRRIRVRHEETEARLEESLSYICRQTSPSSSRGSNLDQQDAPAAAPPVETGVKSAGNATKLRLKESLKFGVRANVGIARISPDDIAVSVVTAPTREGVKRNLCVWAYTTSHAHSVAGEVGEAKVLYDEPIANHVTPGSIACTIAADGASLYIRERSKECAYVDFVVCNTGNEGDKGEELTWGPAPVWYLPIVSVDEARRECHVTLHVPDGFDDVTVKTIDDTLIIKGCRGATGEKPARRLSGGQAGAGKDFRGGVNHGGTPSSEQGAMKEERSDKLEKNNDFLVEQSPSLDTTEKIAAHAENETAHEINGAAHNGTDISTGVNFKSERSASDAQRDEEKTELLNASDNVTPPSCLKSKAGMFFLGDEGDVEELKAGGELMKERALLGQDGDEDGRGVVGEPRGLFRVAMKLMEGVDNRSVSAWITNEQQLVVVGMLNAASRRMTCNF